MRIIARKALREFWERHPDAKEPLQNWFAHVERADWDSPAKVLEEYPRASVVGKERLVFRIKGNTYRMVVVIKYRYRRIYIRFVGTHAEYDHIAAEEV